MLGQLDFATVVYQLNAVQQHLSRAMAVALAKRHASTSARCRQASLSPSGDNDADADPTYAPLICTEQVTMEGRFLKHLAIVCSERIRGDRYILLDQCDWVRKAVFGKGRGPYSR